MAHFPSPFRVSGVDDLLPAGAYLVDCRDEIVQGMLPGNVHGTYRCTDMAMQLAGLFDGRWCIRSIAICERDLEMAVIEDIATENAVQRPDGEY